MQKDCVLLKQLKASAPGTFMMLGEHAVLHGGLSVVCAADQRITVSLQERADREIKIKSALGELQVNLDTLAVEKPFQFILAAIQRCSSQLTRGFELTIQSDFLSTVGLGSSAAVTVATIAVLKKLLGLPCDAKLVFDEALAVIREVQGCGSGADVAASCFGGLVAYRAEPCEIDLLPAPYPLVGLFYSGSKTPTPEVIRFVADKFKEQPEELKAIYEKINFCAEQGADFIKAHNWQGLAGVFAEQQQLMEQLGVSNSQLDKLVKNLQQHKTVLAVKISGSGLGDCVLSLNSELENFSNLDYLPVTISDIGLKIN
jgi:mevalonate kinase